MTQGTPLHNQAIQTEIERAAGNLLAMLVLVNSEVFQFSKAVITFDRNRMHGLTGFEMTLKGDSCLLPGAPDVTTIRSTEDGIQTDRAVRVVKSVTDTGDCEPEAGEYDAFLSSFQPGPKVKTIRAE